jgi:hypothetical protein
MRAATAATLPTGTTDDDVGARIRAAVLRAPLCSPEDRALAHALLAEIESDPNTWPVRTEAETMERLAELHPGDTVVDAAE